MEFFKPNNFGSRAQPALRRITAGGGICATSQQVHNIIIYIIFIYMYTYGLYAYYYCAAPFYKPIGIFRLSFLIFFFHLLLLMLTVRVHGSYIIIIMCVCAFERGTCILLSAQTYIYTYKYIIRPTVCSQWQCASRKNTLCRGGYYSHVLRTVCGIGTIR